jgi:hypothetical protein
MEFLEDEFTSEHEDYQLVIQYLNETLPTFFGSAPGAQARLYMTENDETGYTIQGYGTIAASDGTSGAYELKLALEYGVTPKIVYLQSAHKIALGDAPLEQ